MIALFTSYAKAQMGSKHALSAVTAACPDNAEAWLAEIVPITFSKISILPFVKADSVDALLDLAVQCQISIWQGCTGTIYATATCTKIRIRSFPSFDDSVLTSRQKQLFTNIQWTQTFHSIPVALSKGSVSLTRNCIIGSSHCSHCGPGHLLNN